MNLPELSVKNPITTLMTFIGALMVGVMCLYLLPVDLMPEMDIPSISVITPYDGAAPEEVETKVTEILERYLSTVPEQSDKNVHSCKTASTLIPSRLT